MPVNEPAAFWVKVVPFTVPGMKRCSTSPVAVLKTMIGAAPVMVSTAPLLVRRLGFTATALATIGEPSWTVMPAGVSSWLSEATMEPFFCGPTVRVWVSAACAMAG